MSLTACYQKLSPWLYSPLDRAGRAYLETHLDLLDSESDVFLELFITEHSDAVQEQQRLRLARSILHDAGERGRTPQAVREAYINIFGGLILDPPAWLREIERQWTPFPLASSTDRDVTLGKLRLKGAIEQALLDPDTSPEIWAELHYLLGNLFANDLLKRPAGIFESAVNCYTSALQVYTAERYPLRHAKILMALGDAYRRQAAEQRVDLLLRAVHYYGQALGVYNTCEIV